MKNLIASIAVCATLVINDITGSEHQEDANFSSPFDINKFLHFQPLESFDVVDLRTLTGSPSDMMVAIKGAKKEGSYLYRLWAKIASRNPSYYKGLYDWRVAKFFELIKQYFSDDKEISDCLNGLGEEIPDCYEDVAEPGSTGKMGNNSGYQESMFTVSDKRFSRNPRVSSKNNVSPSVNPRSQADVIEMCWEKLEQLFNSDYKNYCRVRLFLAHYRASQLKNMIHIDEKDGEFRWLIYMTRLETIGLKDEHMIATGELAYKTAYDGNAQATNETLDFLRKLIMSDYFREYWLKQQLDNLRKSHIWSALITQNLRLSFVESFDNGSQSPFGAIGQRLVVPKPLHVTRVGGGSSNFSGSRLSPDAEPFTMIKFSGDTNIKASTAHPWGPPPAYNCHNSSVFSHVAPPPYQGLDR